MSSKTQDKIGRSVVEAAEAALAEQDYVAPVDILLRVGWLHQSHLDLWRQGRVDDLESLTQVNRSKLNLALKVFRRWARERGLIPSETSYVARTRRREPLRFSSSGGASVERHYRTHWISPHLSERKRQRVEERANRPPDLVVISPLKDWTCEECGGTDDFLIMDEPGPLCTECADLDHLVFLPSGNATLTRRAKKASGLSAVVVRFSRSRRRYERQGILVEEAALEQAEAECLADEEVRARRRERDAIRRQTEDGELVSRLAAEIRRIFPGCEPERARDIARHTAQRGSGRVGRSAAGRELAPTAIELAVAASIRHRDTNYDALLMAGTDRGQARATVGSQVTRILDDWRQPPER